MPSIPHNYSSSILDLFQVTLSKNIDGLGAQMISTRKNKTMIDGRDAISE